MAFFFFFFLGGGGRHEYLPFVFAGAIENYFQCDWKSEGVGVRVRGRQPKKFP